MSLFCCPTMISFVYWFTSKEMWKANAPSLKAPKQDLKKYIYNTGEVTTTTCTYIGLVTTTTHQIGTWQ